MNTSDQTPIEGLEQAYDEKLKIARDVCRILREAGYEVTLQEAQQTDSVDTHLRSSSST